MQEILRVAAGAKGASFTPVGFKKFRDKVLLELAMDLAKACVFAYFALMKHKCVV